MSRGVSVHGGLYLGSLSRGLYPGGLCQGDPCPPVDRKTPVKHDLTPNFVYGG